MPPKLEWSNALGRVTRTEPLSEQGVLTWDLIRTAILEGKPDEAIEWLRYIKDAENYVKPGGRAMGAIIQGQLAYIAERWGEPHVEGALRYWRRQLIDAGDEPTYRMTPLERLQLHTETERADYAGGLEGFRVIEEPDRYVLEANPCGSCLPMRRTIEAGPGRTSRGYPWSWGMAGIPYFLAHHALWWEVMSIEDIGYPVRVHEWSDDPDAPCRIAFYKEPALIPEQFFTRVGAKKDPSRFA